MVYRVFTETETGPLQRSDESNSDSAEVDADDTILGATDVTAGEGSTGVVELTWIAPTGAGTGYRIDYAVGGEGTLKWMQEESNTSFADLPYEHEELKPRHHLSISCIRASGSPRPLPPAFLRACLATPHAPARRRTWLEPS